MSVHVSSKVWRLDSAVFGGHEKIVLLKLADCADDDGSNAFPSVRTIARECAISERTVQRTLASLQRKGLISVQVDARPGAYRPTTYRVLRGDTPEPARGDRVTPLRGANVTHRAVTSATSRGDKQSMGGVPSFGTQTRPKTRQEIRPLEPSPLTPRKTGGTPAERAKRGSKRTRDVLALREQQTTDERYLGSHHERLQRAYAARARKR